MADGSQRSFGWRPAALRSALLPGEIVVDLFAGGGGASEALLQALGRDPDVAINHDPAAIAMHAANHPYAKHLQTDVWHAEPRQVCGGRPVGWLHASPDCTHFSQAKGGQPRSRATRSLSWVVLKWAGQIRPRIISLENVRQILQWGPLVAKRTDGRATRVDRSTARQGERLPIDQQWLVPDKRRQGRTWRRFGAALQRLGYVVEWRILRACDYGAGTSRERLFMVARCDGQPIQWPEPTHGPGRSAPYVTAADCIDWSIPCPSIFTRCRPLADATCRRIARGLKRYVVDAAEPFIVQQNAQRGAVRPSHAKPDSAAGKPADVGGALQRVAPMTTADQSRIGSEEGINPPDRHCPAGFMIQCANASSNGVASGAAPLGTITAEPRGGSHAVVAPILAKIRGDSIGCPVSDPLPTITSGAGARRPAGAAHAMGVVAAFLEQANGGPRNEQACGHSPSRPVSTITQSASQQRLVTAHLATLRGDNTGSAAADPLRTLSAGGEHQALVEYTLSPEHEAGALRVAAFVMRYHGTGGQWSSCDEPLTSVTTRDRLALVTVVLQGVPYVIVDIGLRMLAPRELYRAQGFPATYVIDRTADGRRLTKTEQVRMVGNSVSPPPLRAVAQANLIGNFMEQAA